LEKQSKDMWELKDNLRQHVSTAELREMLIANNQDASGSEYDLRDRCVDGMMFGALDTCPLCKSPMEYQGGSYRCRGFLSAWSKCSFSTKTPQRAASKWQIPKNSDNEYLLQWFKRQSNKKGERLLAPTSTAEPEKSDQVQNSGFFSGCEFITYGRLSLSQAKLKEKVEAAGGRIRPGSSGIGNSATCVVTTASSLENEKVRQDIQFAKSLPIVREQYLHDCLEQGKKLPMKGYELELGFKQEVVKVKVKGRGAVHEDSGLQDTGHVLEDGKTIYTVTLNRSELSTGINSFYVLQIIEEDKTKSVHYVYRKWGRVGTSRIGGDKLEKLGKAAAIKEFKRLFREKTGNDWESWEKQENFEKQPGKFYPVEIVIYCIFLTGCAACSASLVMTVVFHFSIC
jgi:predicted DNA-binding WGR domain protein